MNRFFLGYVVVYNQRFNFIAVMKMKLVNLKIEVKG